MIKAFPPAVILFLAVAFFTGCTNQGINSGNGATTTTAPQSSYDQQAGQASSDVVLNDTDVPLVDENDSVEIGEMI